MNRALSHLATEGVEKMKGFYRKRGGVRELLTKGLFLDQNNLFGGREQQVFFIMQFTSKVVVVEMKKAHVTDFCCLNRKFQTS